MNYFGNGKLLVLWLLSFLYVIDGQAQINDLPLSDEIGATPEQDVVDVAKHWFPRLPLQLHDSATLEQGGKFVWIIPEIGYTLQTGFLAQLLGNMAFRRPNANMSTLTGTATYTQNNQAIFTANASVWSRNNQLHWTNDWRVMHYPQATYGLGMFTSTDRRVVDMDYAYLRVYQSVSSRIAPNLYAGAGYALDLHWNIRSHNSRREFTRISGYPYGVEGRSVSTGPLLQLLYDNRSNAINPTAGLYVNAVLRANMHLLGSDNTYQSLLIEARKYVHLTPSTDNVLAFWSYNSLTLSGDPPFLDLPSTGWDTNGNLGRGFIQGRFRGKSLLYAETEYRFHITANRLLGGVVFANAQTVNERITNTFERIVPAVGAGLRLKMNKIARTNLCIDYGFGLDGSRGLFFNLGEVF